MKLLILISLVIIPLLGHANRLESDYQNEWCQGKKEVVLEDRTRVDCLTNTHAIEIEFANKWKEAIGQSLHYSLMTSRKAGIVLIMRKPTDQKYMESLESVINKNNLLIDIWLIPASKESHF
jgi:hypothetical protein